jgi:hypothetical protein
MSYDLKNLQINPKRLNIYLVNQRYRVVMKLIAQNSFLWVVPNRGAMCITYSSGILNV